METDTRLDQELVRPLETFLRLTGGGINLRDIPAARARMDEMLPRRG